MKRVYLEVVALVERLHRQFLEVVKTEIDRMGVHDVNNVQAMILYHIGTDELTVGELTQRGYYLGSNVSYNLKKLIEHEYIAQARSPHDRRSVRIKLAPKGVDLRDKLDVAFQSHSDELARSTVREGDLAASGETLKRLERFWTTFLNGRALPLTTAA